MTRDIRKELAKDLANVVPKNMTFGQIRRLINRFQHKYAAELEVYRHKQVADRFCKHMANAVTGKKRGRHRTLHEWAAIYMRRAKERDLNPQHGLENLTHYLERCLNLRVLPQTNEILREILPWADRRGLIPYPIYPLLHF